LTNNEDFHALFVVSENGATNYLMMAQRARDVTRDRMKTNFLGLDICCDCWDQQE
jgi:hypothetical protein